MYNMKKRNSQQKEETSYLKYRMASLFCGFPVKGDDAGRRIADEAFGGRSVIREFSLDAL